MKPNKDAMIPRRSKGRGAWEGSGEREVKENVAWKIKNPETDIA